MILHVVFYMIMLGLWLTAEGRFTSRSSDFDLEKWKSKYEKKIKRNVILISAIYTLVLIVQQVPGLANFFQ